MKRVAIGLSAQTVRTRQGRHRDGLENATEVGKGHDKTGTWIATAYLSLSECDGAKNSKNEEEAPRTPSPHEILSSLASSPRPTTFGNELGSAKRVTSKKDQQQFWYLISTILAQAQGSLGNTPNSGDMDPRRFRVLPHGSVNGKDGQPAGNDGSIGSPMQSSSPKVRPDQAKYLMKDDMEHFGDVSSMDDNVESFLSHDDGDGRDIFAALKRSPPDHNTESAKDGKLLASGGHEKKAIIWNTDTLQTQSSPEEHSLLITDIHFRPNATQLVTSSFDRTMKLWNATQFRGICYH
ncbi:hypothetical protein Taro_028910 [Colocasia esculenta]|uniref:Uncharacterized protein n=1 Tax=Colocasia esculenta TaxID=4460 RepID=A0A843VCI3_COLES|nr:hypothetical protein [Colocasia esculenta]